jgi:dTDP-4-dehydrorhamnose 3,5-epimerase
MNRIETALPGVMIIEPKVFGDDRGYFMETYNKARYAEIGLDENFVQDNLSVSNKGVLRGLHCQNPNSQGKLVQVLRGSVFDVAVDVRRGSPHFGQYVGVELSAANKRQFYVPPGFAHGFCVTEDNTMFVYKCTDLYAPQSEFSLLWSDPEIGIEWPLAGPNLSEKDSKAPTLSSIDPEKLPIFEA